MDSITTLWTCSDVFENDLSVDSSRIVEVAVIVASYHHPLKEKEWRSELGDNGDEGTANGVQRLDLSCLGRV